MAGGLLILGQSGQLAIALAQAAQDRLRPVMCAGRAEADLSQPGAAASLISNVQPDMIINAAAFTAVDAAEAGEAAAHAINAVAAGEAAGAAARLGARFVHVSTDYVFGGDDRAGPFDEAAPPAPVNAYGRTKLEGEQRVAAENPQAAIVRASAIFSGRGADFPSAMWRLAAGGAPLRIVDDQLTAPTHADALASDLLDLSETPGACGVFHGAGSPFASWADMAEAAMVCAKEAGGAWAQVDRISSREFERPAPRPADSRLGGERLSSLTGRARHDWRKALAPAYALWRSRH